jgi:hypothetical protein
MKALYLVLAFALSSQALAQPSRAEFAAGVHDEKGIQQLVAMAFGGGHHYEVRGSPFHIAQLMPTSGVFTTELFVFESVGGKLALRAHVPTELNLAMKAEFLDGMLVISERHYRSKDAWKVRFYMAPTLAPPGGRPPNTSLNR